MIINVSLPPRFSCRRHRIDKSRQISTGRHAAARHRSDRRERELRFKLRLIAHLSRHLVATEIKDALAIRIRDERISLQSFCKVKDNKDEKSAIYLFFLRFLRLNMREDECLRDGNISRKRLLLLRIFFQS